MRKSNTVMSYINIFVGFLLVVALSVGVYFFVSHNKGKTPLPDSESDIIAENLDSKYVVYDALNGDVINDGNTHAVPKSLVVGYNAVAMDSGSSDVNSISYPAEDTTSGGKYDPVTDIRSIFTLSCNVEPVTATDKSIDWRVEWVDPTAGQGTDFPAAEHAADELLRIGKKTENSCDFLFRGSIPYQMKIVAKSHSNPLVKSECLVDAARRISDSTMTIDSIPVNADYHMSVDNNNKKFAITTRTDEGNGSIDDEFTYSIEVSSNPQMLKMWDEGFTTYPYEGLGWNSPGITKCEPYSGTLGTYTIELGKENNIDSLFNEANFKQIFKYDFDDPKLIEKRSMFTGEMVSKDFAVSKWVVFRSESLINEQEDGNGPSNIVYLLRQRSIHALNQPVVFYSCTTPLVLKLKAIGKYSTYEKEFLCAFNNDTIRRQVSNVTIDQTNKVV